jgi:hypothetical protein
VRIWAARPAGDPDLVRECLEEIFAGGRAVPAGDHLGDAGLRSVESSSHHWRKLVMV